MFDGVVKQIRTFLLMCIEWLHKYDNCLNQRVSVGRVSRTISTTSRKNTPA